LTSSGSRHCGCRSLAYLTIDREPLSAGALVPFGLSNGLMVLVGHGAGSGGAGSGSQADPRRRRQSARRRECIRTGRARTAVAIVENRRDRLPGPSKSRQRAEVGDGGLTTAAAAMCVGLVAAGAQRHACKWRHDNARGLPIASLPYLVASAFCQVTAAVER
jgi:hypothetical protein